MHNSSQIIRRNHFLIGAFIFCVKALKSDARMEFALSVHVCVSTYIVSRCYAQRPETALPFMKNYRDGTR